MLSLMPVGAELAIEDLVPGFAAESELERAVTRDPALLEGLAWGRKRFGHPEGRVGSHVAAILACIGDYPTLRADLRFMALVHDSFKYAVRSGEPWSRDNDHAMLARRFAERYVEDDRVLVAIELHDELFWIWNNGGEDIGPVLDRVPDCELYLRFVELDAITEGKDPSLLWWVRHAIAERGYWLPPPQMPATGEPRAGAGSTVYIETFATEPEDQEEVAEAARRMVRDGEPLLDATGEVLSSEDGVRVTIVWRWHDGSSSSEKLLREGALVRASLQRHNPLLRARAHEAHIYSADPP
jgi:hypothetical protein